MARVADNDPESLPGGSRGALCLSRQIFLCLFHAIRSADRCLAAWQSSGPRLKNGALLCGESGARANAFAPVRGRYCRARARLAWLVGVLAYFALLIYALSDSTWPWTADESGQNECRITKDLCPTGYQPSDGGLPVP
jgi:hypothetical protein